MAPDDGVERDIVGRVTGDPPVTQDGDSWYNATTDKLRAQQNGVISDMIGTNTPNLTGAAYAVVSNFAPPPTATSPVIAPPQGLLVLDTSVPDFTGYPSGPTGPTGATGPIGPTGATGATGPVGPVPEAPNDSYSYARAALGWTNTPTFNSPVTIGLAATAATSSLTIRAAAGQVKSIGLYSGTTVRWAIGSNATAESGSNIGSDFFINRYPDSGTPLIDVPLSISRATGSISLGGSGWHYVNAVGATPVSETPINGHAGFRLNKAGAASCFLTGENNGLKRWNIQLGDNTSESGSNLGSDFSIARYTDAGAIVDFPFTIARSSGYITMPVGIVTIGTSTLASPSQLAIASAAGQIHGIWMSSGGANRWDIVTDGASETGSNAGSNFGIGRHSDAGPQIDFPLSIARATGSATFLSPATFPSNATNANTNPSGLDGIKIDGAAGSGLGISGQRAGSRRWRLVLGDNTSESGSNAGSNFALQNYSDAGAVLAQVMGVNRATGQATFSTPIDDTRPDHGRNKAHNPLFRFALRGYGGFAISSGTPVYGPDRWWGAAAGGDTATISTPPANDATTRAQIGDEEVSTVLQFVFTGTSAAAAYSAIGHRVEGVRRLSNKTVTVSFWAWASVAGMKLGCSIDQIYGTGGSPSASVFNNAVTTLTLANAWTRYSFSTTLPTAIGKVTGTDNNDFQQFLFWLSAGSSTATRAGNPGVQSGTFAMWGVQIEPGGVMTALEKPDFNVDLGNCQRSFKLVPMGVRGPSAGTGATFEYNASWVAMRGI